MMEHVHTEPFHKYYCTTSDKQNKSLGNINNMNRTYAGNKCNARSSPVYNI